MPLLTRRRFLASSAALGGCVALHPFSARAEAGQAHLRVLSTTDLHCHAHPYDYYADRENDTMGLARTASIIADIRAEASNAILVDNGDYLQGNPMGDFIAYSRGMRPGDVHPVIAAMNAIGYDAGTLGNHEFNYGVEFMDLVNAGAAFPIVCANFARTLGAAPRADRLHLRPYVILDRTLVDGAGAAHPIRIGLIGFTPPQIMVWDRAHLESRFAVRGMLEAARAWTPRMREEGADIVVALAHAGIHGGALQLAGAGGVDAVVAGHDHGVFPSDDYGGEGVDAVAGTLHGKPAAMAGFWGSHLGVIDLMLERDGGSWRVAASESAARPIARRTDDGVTPLVASHPAPIEATAEAHAATLRYVRAEVGRTTAPLHSYFALVADDPSVQIVSNAQLWYVESLLRGTEWEGLPLLSAAAPFKAGGRGGPDYYTDVPAGPIAIRNVADIYLYPNTIRAVLCTGAQVKNWLERSAGAFNRIAPGAQDQPLLDPDFRSYNFDVIDGVTYRIDITQPSMFEAGGALLDANAARIIDLAYQGAPVDPEARFVIVTNNYRTGGGGSFPGADGSTIILEAPDSNRDVIVRYIVERGTISPEADANWRLAPADGASVLFDTGPAAQAYLDDLRGRGLAIEHVGPSTGGFARYRLKL